MPDFELRAFIAMRYAARYDAVYDRIRETLIAHRIKPVRADEIPRSGVIHDDIMAELDASDIVIVEASEPSANVYFEAGVAIEKNKPLIILSQDPGNLAFDINNRRALVYDAENLDKLAEQLVTWIGADERISKARRSIDEDDASAVADRWNVVSSRIVRAEPVNSKDEIKRCIREGRLIPCKYLYYFERGALCWRDLCNDAQYRSYARSLDVIEESAAKIARIITDRGGKRLPDYISFGPGVGKKDEVLISSILEAKGQSEDIDYMIYFPVDISVTLINITCHWLNQEAQIRRRVRPRAIVTEFEGFVSARRVLDERHGAQRVFSMLGNTLGNLTQEAEFLRRVQSLMRPNDILLLEVRLLPGNGELEPGGETKLRKRFNFSPLEEIGIPFDDAKMDYVVRNHVSVIGGTRTICGIYRDARFENQVYPETLLTYIHHYDRESLDAYLKGEGFVILDEFTDASAMTALYVLEKGTS